jgi:hypothetical protein
MSKALLPGRGRLLPFLLFSIILALWEFLREIRIRTLIQDQSSASRNSEQDLEVRRKLRYGPVKPITDRQAVCTGSSAAVADHVDHVMHPTGCCPEMRKPGCPLETE